MCVTYSRGLRLCSLFTIINWITRNPNNPSHQNHNSGIILREFTIDTLVLFTKRGNVLPRDIARPRSHAKWGLISRIALKVRRYDSKLRSYPILLTQVRGDGSLWHLVIRCPPAKWTNAIWCFISVVITWELLRNLWYYDHSRCCVNTLRPRKDAHHFADDIFIFLNENVLISVKISLKFVPKGPINNIPALIQIKAWRRPGDKPISEPMMISLPTQICFTRPQLVNDWNCNTRQD